MSASVPGTSPRHPIWAWLPRRSLEPRLQHVLEQIPGAAWLVVPRTGQFLAVNGRATALTGWTRDELLSFSLSEVLPHPDTLSQLYALEAGNTRAWPEVPVRTRSGKNIAVDARGSALQEGDDIVVLLAVSPCEERLSAEREKARQALMLANLHRLIELSANPSEADLPAALARTAELLQADSAGLWLPAATGSSDLELGPAHQVPSGFPAALAASDARALLAPFAWSAPTRGDGPLAGAFRSAGWTSVWAHPVGAGPEADGVLFVAYRPGNPPPTAAAAFLAAAAQQVAILQAQIRRQNRLENTLRRAARLAHQLDAVAAQISEGILVVTPDGQVDEVSGAAALLLGYRSEDILSRPWEEVLNADDGLSAALRQALAGPPQPHGLTLEGHIHKRTGERVPAVIRLRPLDQDEAGWVLVLRDLSRERADEDNRQQADHLAYIGQSIQAFAHEVRAPLNNISMGVQFLAARLESDESLQSAAAKIQAEAVRLSALMNDMLAWAKPVEPRLQPLDVHGLLRRLLGRWGAKFSQRNITHTFHTSGAELKVLADHLLIERVFINLIENAVQAMPAGGHLAVSVETAERAPQGPVLEIKVGDSGPGIPDDLRRRIFDPYFTTKADGTGLGLAISKRLVTVHRGAIACDSFPGAGTIFTVTLPAFADPAPGAEESA